MRARKVADKAVPAIGASWTMIGMLMASETLRKNS